MTTLTSRFVGVAVAAGFLSLGCSGGSATEPDDVAALMSTSLTQSAQISDDIGDWPSSSITVTSASIANDSLRIQFQHGGGCREHKYALVIANAWMESSPVQVAARLAHDDGGDACKALLSRELRVALGPLREAYVRTYGQADRRIRINLSGYVGSLLYTF